MNQWMAPETGIRVSVESAMPTRASSSIAPYMVPRHPLGVAMTKKSKSVAVKPGRPSKYTPEMGERLIKSMAKGYSLSASAAMLGVHRETIYDWGRRFPAFSDSVKRAKAARLLKLERDLLEAPSGPVVTSRIFALKNADPTEWRDKHEHEYALAEGDPLSEFLRSISGNVLRPTEQAALPDESIIDGKVIEGTPDILPTDARVLLPGDDSDK
jgi:hypothetical protein